MFGQLKDWRRIATRYDCRKDIPISLSPRRNRPVLAVKGNASAALHFKRIIQGQGQFQSLLGFNITRLSLPSQTSWRGRYAQKIFDNLLKSTSTKNIAQSATTKQHAPLKNTP